MGGAPAMGVLWRYLTKSTVGLARHKFFLALLRTSLIYCCRDAFRILGDGMNVAGIPAMYLSAGSST